MDVLEILKAAIERAGADGLVNPDCECGCDKEDLAPCGGLFPAECKLARREPSPEGSDYYPGDWFVALTTDTETEG